MLQWTRPLTCCSGNVRNVRITNMIINMIIIIITIIIVMIM